MRTKLVSLIPALIGKVVVRRQSLNAIVFERGSVKLIYAALHTVSVTNPPALPYSAVEVMGDDADIPELRPERWWCWPHLPAPMMRDATLSLLIVVGTFDQVVSGAGARAVYRSASDGIVENLWYMRQPPG